LEGSLEMSREYIVTGVEKSVEEDSFEEGAKGRQTTVLSEGMQGTYSSLKDAIKKMSDKFDFPAKLSEYYAFDEGRLVSSRLEDEDGSEVSPSDSIYSKWEKGEVVLYLASFEVYVEVAEVSELSVEEMIKQGAAKYE
jgi:hypothetical protein